MEDQCYLTRVYFHWRIPSSMTLSVGDSVRVVGDTAALGSWDVRRGADLVSAKETVDPSCWFSADPVLLPLNHEIRYEYVVVSGASQEILFPLRAAGSSGDFLLQADSETSFRMRPTGLRMTVEDDGGRYRGFLAEPSGESGREGGSNSFSGSRRLSVSVPLEAFPVDSSSNVAAELARLAERQARFLGSHAQVIYAAWQLPVRIVRNSESGHLELVANRQTSMYPLFERRKQLNFRFLGFLFATPGDITEEENAGVIDELLAREGCFRVKLDAEISESSMELCTKYLWPLMNNEVPLALTGDDKFAQLWRGFKTMNERFAAALVDVSQSLDAANVLYWLNDYHLILTAEFLRVRMRDAKIGMFMHTTFPSSEVFLTMPVRSEILRSMLASDVVGFQLFEYARHFLTAVRKLTGIRPVYRLGGLVDLETSDSRTVSLRVAHNSVEAELVETAVRANIPNAKRLKNEIGEHRIVIGAVDRYTKFAGLHLKLKAFRQFLSNYPQYRDKVVLVQVVVGGKPPAPMEDLNGLVDAINGEFGPHVIWLEGSKVEEHRLSVLCISDVFLDTSIRDGLNLVPLEYLIARNAYLSETPLSESPKSPVTSATGNAVFLGRLVVSEYSGASRVLSRARRCNPWSQRDVISALDEVLGSWTPGETERRFLKDVAYVRSYGQINWASEFAEDLLLAAKPETRQRPVTASVERLDGNAVVRGFLGSRRRVFVLDHEGTLTGGDLTAKGAGLKPQVLETLHALAQTEDTVVMIVSGRDKKLMEEWFVANGASAGTSGNVRMYLAAEHGFYVRRLDGEWRCMVASEGSLRNMVKWKEIARTLIEVTQRRVANTFMENKGSAIVWQWRSADPVYGLSQAKQLHAGLEEYLKGFNVEITTGKGYTEVRLRGVNKGATLHELLSRESEADFLFCAGDDLGDEFMFDEANGRLDIKNRFTVKIGNDKTAAKFCLPNPEALHSCLSLLAHSYY